MKTAIVNKIRETDYLFNSVYLKLFGERKSLIIFLFHAIFRNARECCSNIIQPLQGISLDHFRQCIEYYLSHDYIFVSPDDILKGLDSNQNYALITFDDGYYNNQHVLPILKQYKIPALFLISTEFVKHNKSFWWDIFHREKMKLGVSSLSVLEEITLLTSSKTNDEIEKIVTDEFGKDAFESIGDVDRPFTPRELRDFSKEKLVFLGNHTSDHAYLANCSPEKIRSTIITAQNDLYDITGMLPKYISYPHGAYSNEVITITKELGLKLGITVDDRKNYLPIDFQGDNILRLGRFALQDNNRLIKQCQLCRADIRLTKIIKNLIRSGR